VADDISAAKRSLRRELLEVRRSIASKSVIGEPTAAERSLVICERLGEVLAERFEGSPGSVRSSDAVVDHARPPLRRVLAYEAVLGEVDLGPLLDSMRAVDVEVVVPDVAADAVLPVSPEWPDVIIVPGVAFDAAGGRLGRGGGWYDRLLGDPSLRGLAVGVAFDPQLVASIPTEDHDAAVDVVVTEHAVYWGADPR